MHGEINNCMLTMGPLVKNHVQYKASAWADYYSNNVKLSLEEEKLFENFILNLIILFYSDQKLLQIN